MVSECYPKSSAAVGVFITVTSFSVHDVLTPSVFPFCMPAASQAGSEPLSLE